MSKLLILIALAILFGGTGCSNRAGYENVRIHQFNECLEEPGLLYEECLERTDKPYEQYERERNEVLGK